MLRVAALQYCASDDVAKTLHHIKPLIAEAASKARLVALPECANYLAASREQLFQRAEWDNESYSQTWLGNIAREFGIWLLAGSLIKICGTDVWPFARMRIACRLAVLNVTSIFLKSIFLADSKLTARLQKGQAIVV